MKKQVMRLLGGMALVAGLGVFGPARPVRLAAAGDVLLTGPATYDFNTLAATDGGADNTVYEVVGNLTLQTGAVIECNDPASPPNDPACDVKIKVDGNLLMEAGSAINTENTHASGRAGNITITVGGATGGTMTMCGQTAGQPGCNPPPPNTPGALITSRNLNGTNAGDVGGDISITVGSAATVTGAFYMEGGSTTYGTETGAKIDATAVVHSGDITITPGGSYVTEPGSVVQSGGYKPGGSTALSNQQGGKIYIISGCQLTTEGRVTSKGQDPGADLIHLEGCEVNVRGLVESTGKGHTVGDTLAEPPHNSCDGNSDGLVNEVVHSDKPFNATGCIEVWGKVLAIDSFNHVDPKSKFSPLWAGELNADIGDGGSQGTSWIDIFAFAQLTVTDGTGNDRLSDNLGHVYFSTYAVHANGIDGSDTTPGVVTAKVKSGPLTASGKAFEASSTMTPVTGHDDGNDDDQFVGNGSAGGTIDVEASGTVTLATAFLNASGDFFGGSPCPSGSGACGDGGHITVKAWGTGSNLDWIPGDGDVQPDNSGGATVGGVITLGACGVVNIDATTNFHGETPLTSNGGANCDAIKPDIPAYPGFFPGYTYNVFNVNAWTLCSASTVSGVKFDDHNGNGTQDAGDLGLGGWTIHLFNASFHATQTTAPNGSYTFTGVPVGTYTVCEAAEPSPATTPPWQQTAPTSGANCMTAVDADNPTPGPVGYTVDLTTGACCAGQHISNIDFGNIQLAIKTGAKFHDFFPFNGVKDAGEPFLPNWTITMWDETQTTIVAAQPNNPALTDANGAYSFTVLPGKYVVCETIQATWHQSAPVAGPVGIVACNTGGLGYAITLGEGATDNGNVFGNYNDNDIPPPPVDCPEDPNRAPLLTRTVNLSKGNLAGGGVAGDPKNYWTVQAAYNAAKAALQPEVIGLFANTNENLLLDGSKSLTITQCTVARVTGAAGSPVWNITSTGKLTIIGPDSVGGSIGWRVAGNGGHTLKSIRANGATVDGVLITSSNNSVSWNDVSGNGNGTATAAGIRVEGNTNTLKGGTVGSNNGDGVQLVGNTNNNLSGATIQSNTGNGVLVSGSTNTVTSNPRINLNGKNGILVTGSTNTLSSNASESGKGNVLNGIYVSAGTGNALTDNKMQSNGQAGINLAAGTSNNVKSNANQNNTGNEFTIASGNLDKGGNKKNGTGFTFTTTGGNFN